MRFRLEDVVGYGAREPKCTGAEPFCINGRVPELSERFVTFKNGRELVVSEEEFRAVGEHFRAQLRREGKRKSCACTQPRSVQQGADDELAKLVQHVLATV